MCSAASHHRAELQRDTLRSACLPGDPPDPATAHRDHGGTQVSQAWPMPVREACQMKSVTREMYAFINI